MADEVKNDGNIINKRTKFLHDLEQFRLINVGRVPKNVHLEEKGNGQIGSSVNVSFSGNEVGIDVIVEGLVR